MEYNFNIDVIQLQMSQSTKTLTYGCATSQRFRDINILNLLP